MRKSFGSLTLLAVFGALVLLLGILAAVQYRWSTRVAAADVQREREHLTSAAALFASDFDREIAQAVQFLQENVRGTPDLNASLPEVPKIISELYYFDQNSSKAPKTMRLMPSGRFEPSTAPEWIGDRACIPVIAERPPRLVIPVYNVALTEKRMDGEVTIYRDFKNGTERCFVGLINLTYLTQELFPRLIRQSFGEATAQQYDFAVTSEQDSKVVLYGTVEHADLRTPFFVAAPLPPLPGPPSSVSTVARKNATFVQHIETGAFRSRGGDVKLFGPGMWLLNIAHKGLPLAEAFERTRRMDLLFSLVLESLLVAGMVFLMTAARRMQRLADQKMQFVAGISHELRTPVSAISMLSRNQADGLVAGTDKVKQYGELIHQQSRRLSDMVEQTLQYAGIHSGMLRLSNSKIDVAALIREVIDMHREELLGGGFEIEVVAPQDLPHIIGDPQLLRTALENLLNNAQKHAGEGHWIRVLAEYTAGEREVCISVEDRGTGIDPSDQDEIFEPFSRGRAAIEAQIPGSGLGLSLVKNAVEAHRGTVTLDSTPGRGSTFTMRLPL
jgi:signal transduction histidine kinase